MRRYGKEIRETMAKKMYIVPLRFGGMGKRLFLEGEEGEDGERKYLEAVRTLDAVGDQCREWLEFWNLALHHFEQAGFLRVAH